jgi:hypothetical protein
MKLPSVEELAGSLGSFADAHARRILQGPAVTTAHLLLMPDGAEELPQKALSMLCHLSVNASFVEERHEDALFAVSDWFLAPETGHADRDFADLKILSGPSRSERLHPKSTSPGSIAMLPEAPQCLQLKSMTKSAPSADLPDFGSGAC